MREALLQHFFPAQEGGSENSICPLFRECPPVTKEEISHILGKSSSLSAPGPDSIPYAVLKQLHSLHPEILPTLTNPLVARGYNSESLKRVEGIVLDKPGKPSYNALSSY